MMTALLLPWLSVVSLVGAPQASLPHFELRQSVERTTVAIGIYAKNIERELEVGTGSIVAEDDEYLTISTAAHVVARASDPNFRVRVLPHKHAVWIEATPVGSPFALDRVNAKRTDDVAFIQIPRRRTEFTKEPLLKGVTFAPAAAIEPGVTCWAYGYDPESEGMQWSPGEVLGTEGDRFEFRASRVREGWSGGPVVINLGRAAMTLREESIGRSRFGVSVRRVAAIAEEQAVPFTIGSDPVLHALLSALELQRPLAVCWHEGQRWVAIQLEENDGLSFRGSWVTYGVAQEDFRGGLRGEVQLDVRSDRLDLVLKPSSDSEIPLPSERAKLFMRPVTTPFVTGHVVLESELHKTTYLAIPTGDCELLAARQILAAATAGRGTPSLEGTDLGVFTRAAKVAGGRYFPFMVSHFVADWPDELVSSRTFTVDEARAGQTFRLRGEVFPMMAPKTSSRRPASYWDRTRIVLHDPVTGSDLGELPRPSPTADSASFDVALEPSTRDFELVLRAISGRQAAGGYALRGLILDYRQ